MEAPVTRPADPYPTSYPKSHIGYLCHLEEPGGNAIELLQRTFKDNPTATPASPDTLGLITLRVRDVNTSLMFYQEALGMQLLSTMTVDGGRSDPFDLYFLGWVDERSPDNDSAAFANREWTYQRQSTLIELQHYRSSPGELLTTSEMGSCLQHVAITTGDLGALEHDLTAAGFAVAAQADTISFESPDGHRFIARLQ